MENIGEKHPDLADPSESVYVWRLKREWKKREKETPYKHTLSQPTYMLVSSANVTNRYGNRRSYRILPLTMSRLMLPDGHVIDNAIHWAKAPVTILQHHRRICTDTDMPIAGITVYIILTSCKYSGRSCLGPAGLYSVGPCGPL